MFKVLYVDDESDLLDIGKLFLERLGDITIDTSESAYEGLKKIARLQYDVIVTDYEMPGMDGIELLKTLRSQGRDIPIIIFTGKGGESVAIGALNNGADFYLQKSGDIHTQYRELNNMVVQVARRRSSERAQKETENQYRLLFNKMNQGYALHEIICDENGLPSDYRFIEVNPEFEHLMGICREDCIGKTLKAIIPDIDPAWITRVGNVALSQVPQTFEENNLCSGKYFEVSAFSPVKGKFAIIMEDITARKVHGDALVVANKKLNLLSSITRHDIKNQLTILLGYLDISKELATTPELSEPVEKEIKAAETIAHQITFTKDYQNMGILAPKWQNVSDVVNRVSETINVHPVSLEVGKSDIEIFADPLLEKVFYNLIDNSIRYGTGMTKISLNTYETPGGQVILYEDNGKGIPASDKARIFEPGFGKNTGLGLFLTREILSITGMTIEETGEYGTGARFEISVPSSIYRYSLKSPSLHQQNISVWQYQAGLTKALENYLIPGSSMNIPLYEQETKK